VKFASRNREGGRVLQFNHRAILAAPNLDFKLDPLRRVSFCPEVKPRSFIACAHSPSSLLLSQFFQLFLFQVLKDGEGGFRSKLPLPLRTIEIPKGRRSV
jgi:hypothetical protein